MMYAEAKNKIERLKEDLESCRNERDRLADEREKTLNAYEEEFDARRVALEDSVRQQVEDAKAPLQKEISALRTELDAMNRAASGDPCGWRECKGRDEQGNAYAYVNDDTGERAAEPPRALEFSIKMRRVEQMEDDWARLAKATRKATEAEAAKRKLQVAMNDAKREAATGKVTIRSWEASSVTLQNVVKDHGSGYNRLESKLTAVLTRLDEYQLRLERSCEGVAAANVELQNKDDVIQHQASRISQLEHSIAHLTEEKNAGASRIRDLERNLSEKVAAAVSPVHLELAHSNAQLMKEKADKLRDYIHLAEVWPEGWVMPSILKRLCARKQSVLQEMPAGPQPERVENRGGRVELHNQDGYVSNVKIDTDEMHPDLQGASTMQKLGNCPPGAALVQKQISAAPGQGTTLGSKENIDRSWTLASPLVTSSPCKKSLAQCEAARTVVAFIKRWNATHEAQDALPYDIHTVEELAGGIDSGINTFNEPSAASECEYAVDERTDYRTKSGDAQPTTFDLRQRMSVCSKAEEDLLQSLERVRHEMVLLSQRLLENAVPIDRPVMNGRVIADQTIGDALSGAASELNDASEHNDDRLDRTEMPEASCPVFYWKSNEAAGKVQDLNQAESGEKRPIAKATDEGQTSDLENTELSAELSSSDDHIDMAVRELAACAVWVGFSGGSSCFQPSLPAANNEDLEWVINVFRAEETHFEDDVDDFDVKLALMNRHNEVESDAVGCQPLQADDLDASSKARVIGDSFGILISESAEFPSVESVVDRRGVPDIAISQHSTSAEADGICSKSQNQIRNAALSAIECLSEEEALYEREKQELQHESNQLQGDLRRNHLRLKASWTDAIEESEKQLKELTIKIASVQRAVAGVEAKIRGLKIIPAKPTPPKPVPPIKVLNIPPHLLSSNESSDEGPTSAMPQEAFDGFLRLLLDTGDAEIPFGQRITEEQKVSLTLAIAEKNKAAQCIYEQDIQDYNQALETYRRKEAIYGENEEVREADLALASSDLKLLSIQILHLRETKQAHEQYMARSQLELQNEEKRDTADEKLRQNTLIFRSKLTLETIEGRESLDFFQREVQAVLRQRKVIFEIPQEATSYLGQIEEGMQRDRAIGKLGRRIRSIRESMIREGKRLRLLWQDGLKYFRALLVMLRESTLLQRKRSVLFTLSRSLNTQMLDARERLYSELSGTNVAISQSESERDGLVAARNDVDSLNGYLESVFLALEPHRDREVENGSDLLPSNNSRTYGWLAKAEGDRLRGEITRLKASLKKSLAVLSHQQNVATESIEELRARNSCIILQVDKVEQQRKLDLIIVRRTVEESVAMLRERIDDMAVENQRREDIYRAKVRCLKASLKETNRRLSSKVESLRDEVIALRELSAVLRFELSEFHAKDDTIRLELEKMRKSWMIDGADLKQQLQAERKHSARLELMIITLKSNIDRHVSELEARDQRLKKQQQVHDLALRQMRGVLRNHQYAMQSLGMSVDSLFSFFLERLANLAGAGKRYNDALRENGAIETCAILCKASRSELRSLSIEILAGMCWNGSVEERLLAFDIKQSWQVWTDLVATRTKHRTMNDMDSPDDLTSLSSRSSTIQYIRERRKWAMRRKKISETPNRQNQIRLGSEEALLETMVELSFSPDYDIATHSMFALCAASFDENSAKVIGDFIPKMIDLCTNKHERIRGQAAITLANLGLGNRKSQDLIGASGGIKILLELCRDGNLQSVEAATGALANIVLDNSLNSEKVLDLSGMDLLVDLITGDNAIDLVDQDQYDEIQANAVECLSYLAFCEGIKARAIDVKGLVLLAGSSSIHVQKSSALLIGTLARDANYRRLIGMVGGVEALFLLCEKSDEPVQTCAFWALANLAWEPLIQERVGRYFEEIVGACMSSIDRVRVNAMCCLANALCFNEPNQARFWSHFEQGSLIKTLVGGACTSSTGNTELMNIFLRILISLSYNDETAISMSLNKEVLNAVVTGLSSKQALTEALSSSVLLNLSSHPQLRKGLVQVGFLEHSVALQKSKSKSAREASLLILEQLRGADMRPDGADEKKLDIGIQGMLGLCRDKDPTVQLVALNRLAEEIWSNQEKQIEILQENGVEIILDACMHSDREVLIAALNVLRNLAYHNNEAQAALGGNGAINILMEMITKTRTREGKDALEAMLTAMVNLVIDHEQNSLSLLKFGIDALIEIAEGRGKSCAMLAISILEIVAPFSCFTWCTNCGKKQPTGISCEHCGRRIQSDESFDLNDKENRAQERLQTPAKENPTKTGQYGKKAYQNTC